MRIAAAIVRGAFFLTVCSIALTAQQFSFQFYGAAQGLTNLAVRGIFQDRAGYLWLTTEGGVFRYDGTRFRHFGSAEGLPPNVLMSFSEVPSGALLAATDTGLFRWDGTRFTNLPIPGAPLISSSHAVRSDADGTVYVATARGLWASDNPQETNPSWRHIENPAEANGATSRGIDIDGKAIWYGCGTGLCKLENGHVQVFGIDSGIPARRWGFTVRDGAGTRWLTSNDGDLMLMKPGSSKFVRWANPIPLLTPSAGALDLAGHLLLPSAEGLLIWNDGKFEVVGRPAGLLSPVYSQLQDREGSMWIGLGGRGLAKWPGYQTWEGYGPADGLDSEVVYSILPLDSQHVIAGTESGLFWGSQRAGHWKWKEDSVYRKLRVRKLQRDGQGTAWICAESEGLGRLDLETRRVTWFAPPFPGSATLDFHIDRKGLVWVATDKGLFTLDPPKKRLVPYPNSPVHRMLSIAETSNGNIWAAMLGGLCRISMGKVRVFTPADGLADRRLLSLAASSDDSLWVGYMSSGAVTRLRQNGEGIQVENHEKNRPGPASITYFLNFDRKGNLWAGTDQGVHVWNGREWSRYTREDGLIWDDCNLHAFAEGSDGTVWIGTSGGLSRFSPGVTYPARQTPPVPVFTRLVLGNNPVTKLAGLSVDHSENSLSASYSALTFVHEQSISFRYRLAPTSLDWRETGSRELQFPDLPGGHYRLEVLARNGWGVLSTTPAIFDFVVRPPWWLTPLAKVSYVFLVVCMLAGLVRWRSWNLHRHMDLQEREWERARILAEAKAQLESFSHMNRVAAINEMALTLAHEICQPLCAISFNAAAAIMILDSNEPSLDEAREAVSDILKDQERAALLIDRARLGLKPAEFRPQLLDPNQLVREAMGFARHHVQSKGASLDLRLAPNLPAVTADEIQMQQVIWNLVQNGVDAMEALPRGKRSIVVRTTLDESPDRVLIEVEDSGPGIPDACKNRVFEPHITSKEGGLGMGLAICRSIVAMCGGHIWVEDAKSGGALFRIQLLARSERNPPRAS